MDRVLLVAFQNTPSPNRMPYRTIVTLSDSPNSHLY